MTNQPGFRLGIAPDAPADRTALIDCRTGERIGYGELTAAVRHVAATLLHRGLSPGEVVALVLGNGVPFAVAYHGVLLAGGTVQPLDPLAPASEWERAVSVSEATWLVTDRDHWRQLAGLSGARTVRHTVLVDDPGSATLSRTADEDGSAGEGTDSTGRTWITWEHVLGEAPAPGRTPFPEATPAATAVLASSSGTQGQPRHVVLTHHNLARNLDQIHARHQLTGNDVVMTVTPWRHIYGMQMALNHTLLAGGTLIATASPFDFTAFLRTAQEHRVTVVYLVPDIIARLVREPAVEEYDLSALRVIFSGGAPLPPATAAACGLRLGAPVLQGFGMTEAGCTHLVPDGATAPDGSVGLPLPGTEVRVVDPDTGAILPPGGEGELWVRGPQISPGQLVRGHTTAPHTAADGWLRTGDLARVDGDGYCSITGRLKELIKYKGHQVAPAELEAILLAHPAVADAAVVGVPDPTCGELPKAFVVLAERIALGELMDHVAEHVPPQRRIRLIEAVASLPRNASGKLLRHALVSGSTRP
ncbi:AMP-binding protein [Streptomyces sp. NPDC127068]|uniref:AMP-binding protein n=1 Tax=Streptomyces sp. NPDC127068 TaxID=3347127 RepID=UPI0036681D21